MAENDELLVLSPSQNDDNTHFWRIPSVCRTGASFHQSDLSAAILFCKAQKMQLPSIQTRLLQCL
jgi:hypothetical protein